MKNIFRAVLASILVAAFTGCAMEVDSEDPVVDEPGSETEALPPGVQCGGCVNGWKTCHDDTGETWKVRCTTPTPPPPPRCCCTSCTPFENKTCYDGNSKPYWTGWCWAAVPGSGSCTGLGTC